MSSTRVEGNLAPQAAAPATHGPGRRIFVGEVSGTYADLSAGVLSDQRVFPSADVPFRGGPRYWLKSVVGPGRYGFDGKTTHTQMFECHLDVYAPGASQPPHAHLNSVVLYILSGRGYDIHDGRRIDWQAGDVVIVEPGCVQQHVNASDTEFARVLVMKAKPLFMFANLIYQKKLPAAPGAPLPGYEDIDPARVDPYSRAAAIGP